MTGHSKTPYAALGVRAHTGWAAAIVLGGAPDKPTILERRRMQLCDPKVPESKFLFHAAEPMPLDKASAHIARCTASSAGFADDAMAELREAAQSKGHRLAQCRVLGGMPRALPELAKILASHSLLHAAEGEFFRDAVMRACARAKIATARLVEHDVLSQAADRLGRTETQLKLDIDALGKPLGPPWTADQKLATAAAWLALAAEAGEALGVYI